jgi:hypothetical protein
MARKNPTMFGSDEGEIDELSSISGIVEELLVGLIPLRGRAVDYSVVVFDRPEDGKLIVHNRLLESLKDKSGFTMRPLFVVGVTEQTLFWKDIRRVLFAGQRFRVLCRVARDEVSNSWVPLKLQEVLGSMFPDLDKAIEKFNRGDLFRAEIDGAPGVDADQEHAARSALRAHALWMAESNGVGLSESVIAEIDAVAGEHLGSFETEEEKREAFRMIENYMTSRYDLEIDAEAAKDSRRRAREGVGAAQSMMLGYEPESDSGLPDGPIVPDDEYFLDSEFVAIYW